MTRTKIYILGNAPYLFLVKIGISKNVKTRRSGVEKTTKGVPFVIFSLSVPFAYFFEQLIHVVCRPLNVGWYGSGKTEWFIFPAILIALPVIVFAALFEIVAVSVILYAGFVYFFE